VNNATEGSTGVPAPPPAGDGAEVKNAVPARVFAPLVLNIGFIVGLALAAVCLGIAGFHLISYQLYARAAMDGISNGASDAHALIFYIYMARVLLLSCGLAVGMAFGFLGFSLFLFGIEGSIDASAQGAGGVGLQVARLSPGAFVMLCSAILVGMCATREVTAQVQEAANEARAVSDTANRYEGIVNGAGNGSDSNEPNLAEIEANGAVNQGAAQ
jgi:hypothetical protein